jgi:hypothetical protein
MKVKPVEVPSTMAFAPSNRDQASSSCAISASSACSHLPSYLAYPPTFVHVLPLRLTFFFTILSGVVIASSDGYPFVGGLYTFAEHLIGTGIGIDHLPKLLIPLQAKARSSEIHDRFINIPLIESTSHWFKKRIRYTIIAETTTYSIDTSHTSHQPPQSTPSTYNAHCVPFIVQNGI